MMTINPTRYLGVGEAAKRIGGGVTPKDISDLFYTGRLRDDLCPIVAGRRLIPEEYLCIVVMALKRAGRPVGTSMGKGAGDAK